MPFLGDGYLVRGHSSDTWTLAEPLDYLGNEECFSIPVGFTTDFATIPRFATWLFPRTGVHARVAILHDYLCVEAHGHRFSRADADGIFRRVLRETGISWPRRWMMWAACRVASGLEDANVKEAAQFLGIALPAIVFLLIPTAVLLAWMLIFWLIELPFRWGSAS